MIAFLGWTCVWGITAALAIFFIYWLILKVVWVVSLVVKESLPFKEVFASVVRALLLHVLETGLALLKDLLG